MTVIDARDMLRRENAVDMPPEVRRQRFEGVGASESAAILGLSDWRTALDVYAMKVVGGEHAGYADTEPLRWGKLLERLVLEEYARRTGRSLHEHPPVVWCKDVPMFANLDAVTMEGGRVVEAKTSSSGEGWGEPGTDQVPKAYLIQAMHQMVCSGREICDIAVLIKGNDFRIYTVEFNEELSAIIKARVTEFWQQVKDRRPPKPQKVGDADKAYRFPVGGSRCAVTPELLGAIDRVRQYGTTLKDCEKNYAEAQEELKRLMQNNEVVESEGRVLATWKEQVRASFDVKALGREYPLLISQFTKPGRPFRVLRVKGE